MSSLACTGGLGRTVNILAWAGGGKEGQTRFACARRGRKNCEQYCLRYGAGRDRKSTCLLWGAGGTEARPSGIKTQRGLRPLEED